MDTSSRARGILFESAGDRPPQRRAQADRPEQPRLQERRRLLVVLPGREGDAPSWGLGFPLRVPVRQTPHAGCETTAAATSRAGATAVFVLGRQLLVADQS